MKKYTLLLLLSILPAGMTICSCSDSRSEQQPESSGDEIRFSAVAPSATRVNPTTTATLDKFVVYAYTNGKPFMNNVLVTRSGSSWTYAPLVYWPTTPVNFYAFSPNITNVPGDTLGSIGSIPNFINYGDTDLLYAVQMGETKRQAPVQLNFRHAMSNVNVRLSSSNPLVKVRVGHVSLMNISISGTFNFPKESTTLAGGIGSWSGLGEKKQMLLTYYHGPEDFPVLTSEPENLTTGNLDVNFMIPQPLEDFYYSGTSGYGGAYIAVDCEVFDAATGIKIWPNKSTLDNQLVSQTSLGRMGFPVTTENVREWKPGYSYIYNVVVNYPEGEAPITFDVTVDEFETGIAPAD